MMTKMMDQTKADIHNNKIQIARFAGNFFVIGTALKFNAYHRIYIDYNTYQNLYSK